MSTNRQKRKARRRAAEARAQRIIELRLAREARARELADQNDARDKALALRHAQHAAEREASTERHSRPGETRPRSQDKDLDHYLELAWRAGWTLRRQSGSHIKAYPPGESRFVSVPGSPSRQRTIARIRSSFRRLGLSI